MKVETTLQTADDLAELVADFLQRPVSELPRETSLFEYGLDSIQVMRIAGKLRAAGYKLTYGEMLRQPNLDAWWRSIASVLIETRGSTDKNAERDKAAVATDEATTFPLTPLQQAYLIGRHPDQPYGGVACHGYLELDGEGVVSERLKNSITLLMSRHPMLRASFRANDTQTIEPSSESWTLTVHNFQELSSESTSEHLQYLRDSLSHRVLNVEKGKVFDFQLSLLPRGKTRVHFNIDLLAADVRSVGIILRDLALIYEGEVEAPTPPIGSFIEHCHVQSNLSGRNDEDIAYWNQRLATLPGPPSLPIASNREYKKPRFVRRKFTLTKVEVENLKTACQKNGVTMASTLLSVFCEVISFWCEIPSLLINLPIFNRKTEYPGIDDVVGDFTNIILVDVELSDIKSFAELNKTVLSTLHEGLSHSGYSGINVLRDLARQASESGELGYPRAPIVFACNLEIPFVDERCERTLGKLGWMISQTPQVWLDHQVNILNDGSLLLNWDALEGTFPPDMVDTMFDLYEGLIRGIGKADWGKPLTLTLPQSQQEVRARVNGTKGPISHCALHELFFQSSTKFPDNLAIATRNESISYGELAQLVENHADQLKRNGAAPGDRILIWLPKGIEQISYILATLAIGGVFVPISADTPSSRVGAIYSDCQATLLITSRVDELSDCNTASPIARDTARRKAGAPPNERSSPSFTDPNSLAYIIYTSGSTGTPKGVMINHDSAANTILDVNERLGVSDADRIFGISEVGFDLSIYDIFGALASGATLVLPEEMAKREPREWLSLIREREVTIWNSVPALMEMLLVSSERDAECAPTTLRAILLSGDWIGLDLPPRIRSLVPNARIVALGGATEASIWSNWYEVEAIEPHWVSIPYGVPLRNQTYRVFDNRLRDKPDWVPGDLYIGGSGVAQGYWGDADKTNSAFIKQSDGNILYRTGDIGRYWPDGNIEFLGRKDYQVKIRGHRIELGEIEVVLSGHPGIERAFAVVDESMVGSKKIAAYLIESEHCSVDKIDIDRFISSRIPEYMIPDKYYIVDHIPLTANGKLNKKKLDRSKPLISREQHESAPLTDIGKAIVVIWKEILQSDDLFQATNFFHAGGDSLLAVRMASRVSTLVGYDVAVTRLFSYPTLEDYISSFSSPTNEMER